MININKREHILNRRDKRFFTDPFIQFATINNKEQLNQCYHKDSCKLPPIRQSRIIPLEKFNQEKVNMMGELNRYDEDNTFHPTGRVHAYQDKQQMSRPRERNNSVSFIPRLGRILFDKDNHRKINRQYLVSYSSLQPQNSSSNICKSHNIELDRKLKDKKHRTEHIGKQEQGQYLLFTLMKDMQDRIKKRKEMNNLSFSKKIIIQRKENMLNLNHMSQSDSICQNINDEANISSKSSKNNMKKQLNNLHDKTSSPSAILKICKQKKVIKNYDSKIQKLQPWCQQNQTFSLLSCLPDLQ